MPSILPPARKVHNKTIQRNALPTLLYPPLFHPLGANGVEAGKIQRYSLLTVAKVREEGPLLKSFRAYNHQTSCQ